MSSISNNNVTKLPGCDYLIVGGGASGMAFADSFLRNCAAGTTPSVVVVDKHPAPGGQWHDSYDFVRLHQPSAMYGVESEMLEPDATDTKHRATRRQIIDYYQTVADKLEKEFDFRFCGGMEFDFDSVENDEPYVLTRIDDKNGGRKFSIDVAKKVVDARFLEPDLPVFVGPKFKFDPEKVQVVPVNTLADEKNREMIGNESLSAYEVDGNVNGDEGVCPKGSGSVESNRSASKKYVVIGGGKTGMDAVVYLQTAYNTDPDDIVWVVPHEAWITAREDMGSCMEFLYTCVEEAKKSGKSPAQLISSPDFLQNGFLKFEEMGKVYRFSNDAVPQKFKDATLCKREMALLKRVKKVIRGARVQEIDDNGGMHFEDGRVLPLPWKTSKGGDSAVQDTTFIHCSAGAFNYTKLVGKSFPKVFGGGKITIQDVYGTPGFCFAGSVIGKLEAMENVSDDVKNSMCLAPQPSEASPSPLGPSGGDVGVLSEGHGLVQRLSNVRSWYSFGLGEWLHGSADGMVPPHRLFNLSHLRFHDAEVAVQESWEFLKEAGLVVNSNKEDAPI